MWTNTSDKDFWLWKLASIEVKLQTLENHPKSLLQEKFALKSSEYWKKIFFQLYCFMNFSFFTFFSCFIFDEAKWWEKWGLRRPVCCNHVRMCIIIEWEKRYRIWCRQMEKNVYRVSKTSEVCSILELKVGPSFSIVHFFIRRHKLRDFGLLVIVGVWICCV
jgi:hypothetical protein